MKKKETPSTILYNPEQEPLNIPKGLSDLIAAQDNPSDLIGLFWFYYKTAKWQGSNTARATNTYVMKGLHWTQSRVIKIAKQLEALNIIERTVTRDPQTKSITAHFIRLNISVNNPIIPTLAKTYSVGPDYSKEKSIIPKKINLKKAEKFDPTDLPSHFAKLPRLASAWALFVASRKEKRSPIHPTGFKMTLKDMAILPEDVVVDALTKAAAAGWIDWRYGEALRLLEAKKGKTAPAPNRTPVQTPPTSPEAMAILEIAGKAIHGPIDTPTVTRIVKELFCFYSNVPTPPGEGVPHTTWKMFFRAWLESLTRDTRYPIRSLRDFEPRGGRWEYFLRQKGEEIGIDLRTGKKWGRS